LGFSSLFVRGKKFNLFVVIFSFFIIYQLIGIYSVQSLNHYSVPFYVSNQTTIAKNPTFSLINLAKDEIRLNFDCKAYISGTGDSVCSYYAPLNNLITTAESSATGDCVDFGQYDYQNVQNIDNIESSYFLTSSASSFYLKPKTDLIVNADDDYLIFYQNLIKDELNHVKNFLSDSEQREQADEISLSGWVNNNIDTYNNNLSSCLNHNFEPLPLQSYGWACDGGGTSAYKLQYYIRLFPFNSSYSGLINYDISMENVICSTMSGGECATGREIGYFEFGESKTIITTGLTASGELSLNPNSHYVFYMAKYGRGKGTGTGTFPPCSLNEGDYNTTFNITIITPDWDCGEWSDCVNGSQYRLCIDLNDKLKDKLENRFCYVEPEKSVYLGFEDYRTTSVWYNYLGFWCQYDSETKEVLYPEGWFVANPNFKVLNKNNQTGKRFDFIKMTSETAYEGDKSLKMWNIPPQLRIPDFETFISIYNTETTDWVSPSNYTDNSSWVNLQNSFGDGVNYSEGSVNGNVIYKGYDIESKIPNALQYLLKNLTVRLDTNKGGSPDTVQYSCIQISINGEWSSCKTITGLTVDEQSFLVSFDNFVINYDVCALDTLEVRLILSSGGTGTIQLDWIPVKVEYYNPETIGFIYQDVIC